MPRTASTFRQNDITRAIRGAKAAGCKNPRAEIVNGKIIIVAETDSKILPPVAGEDENEWDGVK
jgi:hypothetical protein